MAHYPDCGHDYCNCPSHPAVVARREIDKIKKKASL
jgi:hypothetical protein